jgi:hypothetical protein
MTSLVKAKVSTVVSKQAPEFVREEHAQFIKFLEAYYEWMELPGNAGFTMRNIESARDIDKTVDDFVQYFQKELMVAIPEYVLTDKRILAQRIHDLYRAKGTQQSYELLFRILYNEPADIYYPKVDLLRSSAGRYDKRTVIKVIEKSGDAFKLVGQTITQAADIPNGIPLATARVESVIKTSAGENIVAEINVNATTLVGTFVSGATITGLNNNDDSLITMTSQTLISDVRLDSKGSYYSIGQKFTTAAGSGLDFLCEVATVQTGKVSGVFVETPGSNYHKGQAVTFNNTDTGGYGATAIVEEVDQTAILLETATDAIFSSGALTFDIGDSTSGYTPLPSYSNLAGTRLTGVGTGASFNVGYVEGAPDTYSIGIYAGGDKYAVGNTIKILGTSVGGATPANDITITIASINDIAGGSGDFTVGLTWQITSLGNTTQTQWNQIAGTSGVTYTIGSRFVSTMLGYGKGSGKAVQTGIDTITFTGTAASVSVTPDADRATGRVTDTSITSNTDSYMLLENGSKIIPEDASIGGIKSIRVIDGGKFYNKVPVPTAVTTTGSGAKLVAYGEDIGRITGINITNLGVYYESKPSVAAPVNAIIKSLNATNFLPGEPIYSEPEVLLLESGGEMLLEGSYTDRLLNEEQNNGYGKFDSYNSARNLLTISPANIKNRITAENGSGYVTLEDERKIVTEDSGEFTRNQIIHGLTSGARARVVSIGHADVTPIRGALGKYVGVFIGADGKVSESSKKMPDNLYYQEFSYVIKVGLSIDKYRDAVKRILHPVGLAMFGQVAIQSTGNASMPGTLNRSYNPSNILLGIRAIIDAKMKSQHRDTVLVFPLFVEANMRMHILASDFLPTLYFPRSEPLNVYVLDLRATEIHKWQIKIGSTGYWLDPNNLQTLFARSVLRIESKVLKANVQLVGGPTLGNLEKLKFFIPPYEAGTKNSLNLNRGAWSQPYPSTNSTYWDTYGTTQIKDFGNIVLSDVINNPSKKFDFCLIDAHIDIVAFPPGDVTFDSSLNYISMDNTGFLMDLDTERSDSDDIFMDDNYTTMDSIK